MSAAETLTVWAMGEEGQRLPPMARAFERLHPGVTVVTQAIPWEAAHEKLLTAVVGGIPPDVCQVGTTWMPEFAAMGALEPLDHRLARVRALQPNHFFPGSWATCQVQGQAYGVPWYVDTRVLFYRKDLLAEAGFSHPPRTWEELKTACQALTKLPLTPGVSRRYGMALGTRDWMTLLIFVWQNGGDALQLTDPRFREALTFYLSFFREHLVPSKEGADVDLFHAFKTGMFPMFISGPWMVELLQKELPELERQWAVAMLPRKRTPTSFVGGCNLVLFKESRKKDLGWQFIEFMSQPEQQVEWHRLSKDLPAARAAWQHTLFQDKPRIRIFGDQMDFTESPPRIPEWEEVGLAIDQGMERLVLQDPALDHRLPTQLATLQGEIDQIRLKRQRGAPLGMFLTLTGSALGTLGLGTLFVTRWRRAREQPSTAASPAPSLAQRLHRFHRTSLAGYLFIAPAVLLLLVFLFLPILASFTLSFTDWDVTGIQNWRLVRFIGWANYWEALTNRSLWKAFFNTLYFTGVGVPLTILASLIAAVSLNQVFVRFRILFRAAFFAPVVTTIVAVAVVWRWLYNPEYGLFNWLLISAHLHPQTWLSDPRLALPSLILMAVWKNFGYNMIIFLAGLQTIPTMLYEAARIDGAGALQCFWNVTLPGLRPTMLFVVVITTIGYLQFFAEPYVMTKGGPLEATTSIVYYMFNQGFKFFKFGYASAIAYLLFGLIFCCTLFQLRLRKSGYETQ